MWFKSGDKIKVRDDLFVGRFDGVDAVYEMMEYRGITLTVTGIVDYWGDDCVVDSYTVEENGFLWSDSMLCPPEYADDDCLEYSVDIDEFMKLISNEV